jgi:phenylalanyl-tRNA synthetase alpha chain
VSDDLSSIEATAAEAITRAPDLDALREVETVHLGKRSALSGKRQELGALEPDERKKLGQSINETRGRLEAQLAARRSDLEATARREQLEAERLDLTEHRAPRWRGHIHLITQTRHALEDVFVGMGFHVAEGPEVETDWYNFEALNIPPAHPARAMQDTLYVDWGEPESTVLRTHTSPIQIHVMKAGPPPIYSVGPGRVFRRDTADTSHMPVFHQIECLVVDHGISMGDLAGTIDTFTAAYFGSRITSRLRPSYFPFTEPSAELDITCVICEGRGCRTCGQTGWLELGGCGMVHPNVFTAVGYDPEEWTGFAFGFGIERLAMMRYGIDDVREFFSNDVRFVEQF